MEISKRMVILDESALTHIVMSSLESYVIGDQLSPEGRIETCGLLWGTKTYQIESGKNVAFYHIKSVSTDTSAKRENGSVISNLNSLRIKRDLQRAINPTNTFIGDYHSHPYSLDEGVDIADVRAQKLYEFSPQDHEAFSSNPEFYKSTGLSIALVATILPAKNRMTDINAKWTTNKLFNSFEFCLSNYRIWVTAYRASFKKNGSLEMLDDVFIHCPYIFGLQFPLMNFGYFSSDNGHQDFELDI